MVRADATASQIKEQFVDFLEFFYLFLDAGAHRTLFLEERIKSLKFT